MEYPKAAERMAEELDRQASVPHSSSMSVHLINGSCQLKEKWGIDWTSKIWSKYGRKDQYVSAFPRGPTKHRFFRTWSSRGLKPTICCPRPQMLGCGPSALLWVPPSPHNGSISLGVFVANARVRATVSPSLRCANACLVLYYVFHWRAGSFKFFILFLDNKAESLLQLLLLLAGAKRAPGERRTWWPWSERSFGDSCTCSRNGRRRTRFCVRESNARRPRFEPMHPTPMSPFFDPM